MTPYMKYSVAQSGKLTIQKIELSYIFLGNVTTWVSF